MAHRKEHPRWTGLPLGAWRRLCRGIARTWKEILTGIALVGGWGLITLGLAELLRPEVWPLSGGLLLLSLCGWGFLKDLFMEGLYVLSRSRRE